MPLIQGWNPVTIKFFNNMMKDYFEIEHALLKARMKRVIRYINYVTKMNPAWSGVAENIQIPNLKEMREDFERVSQNDFDPEFKVSATNGFQLIVNHNLNGPERYSNLLLQECH